MSNCSMAKVAVVVCDHSCRCPRLYRPSLQVDVEGWVCRPVQSCPRRQRRCRPALVLYQCL